MTKPLHESLQLTEAATASDRKSGRMSIQVLSPGWGTSGYYSAEVCEAAADLVAVGTQMFIDHPTETETAERPVRSVRDIAAVVTEDARWDAAAQALVAECQVTAPYREFLADENLAPHIGLSIRGSATDITVGEAEGRSGSIIEGLAEVKSIDFVTRAGRGGKILQVLEHAAPADVIARAVGHGIEEATADERRQQLSDVIRTAYGSNRRWAWVRDFDETTVWFEASGEDEASKTWQQTYDVADDDLSITLTGARTEVRPITKYVSVTRPDSFTPTTEESQEDTMGKIQIEEAEHSRLTEKAGRVDVLESELAAEKAKTTALQEAQAVRTRNDRAVVLLTEAATTAGVEFTALERRGLLADLPLKEGAFDEAAFTTAVAEAAAAKLQASGTGTVRGFGGDTTPVTEGGEVTDTDLDRALAESFNRPVHAGQQTQEA